MSNKLVTRGGGVIVRSSGVAKMAFNSTANNAANFGASKLLYAQAGNELDVYLDLKVIPAGMVEGYVVVKSYTSPEDIREVLFPREGTPFTPTTTSLINLGTSIGIVAEDNAVAYIIPVNAAGEWGRPSDSIPIEEGTTPETDVDVTLITAPSIGTTQTEGTNVSEYVEGAYTGEGNVNDPLTVKSFRLQDSADGTTGWADIGTVNVAEWPNTVRAKGRIQETVTGKGIATTLVTNSNVVDVLAPTSTLVAPIVTMAENSVIEFDGTDDYVITDFTISNPPTGVYLTDWWMEWTTSSEDQPADNQIETTIEATYSAGSGAYGIQMMDPDKRGDPNVQSPRSNYGCFKWDGTALEGKANRLRIRYAKTGDVGPFTDRLTVNVPDDGGDPVVPSDWVYMVTRTPTTKAGKYISGQGQQFYRSYATSPDSPNLLIAGQDENAMWASEDFGDHVFTPKLVGGHGLSSCCSVWLDPENANHWLMAFYAGAYGPKPTSLASEQNAYSGIYRSTDRGATCRLVKRISMTSTQASGGRYNRQNICHDPSTSGDNKHIYYASLSSWGTPKIVRIFKSTNNGVAWNQVGDNLSGNTFANGNFGPCGLNCTSDGGTFFMNTGAGLWRSTDGCESWTRIATEINSSLAIYDCHIAGGTGADITLWVSADLTGKTSTHADSGMWKSTNSGNTFVKNAALGVFKAKYFAISPHNSNHIALIARGQGSIRLTNNGGTSWISVPNNHWPGYSTNVGGSDSSGIGVWHTTDQGRVALERSNGIKGMLVNAHRVGQATNSPTNEPAGTDFEGTHFRGMGFDRSDPLHFCAAAQDVLLQHTKDGGVSWQTQAIINDQLKAITDPNAEANAWQATSCFLTRSNRVVIAAGVSNKEKCVGVIKLSTNFNDNDPDAIRYFSDGKLGNYFGASGVDPTDDNVGYIGKYRLTNINAAAVGDVNLQTLTNGHTFCGVTNSGRVWAYSGRNVYYSDSGGVGTSPWTLFQTAGQDIGDLVADHVSNNRVYCTYDKGLGRLNGSTLIKIFDQTDTDRPEYMEEITASPAFFSGDIGPIEPAVDHRDPNIMYVCYRVRYQSKFAFRTLNALGSYAKRSGTGNGTVTNIEVLSNAAVYGKYVLTAQSNPTNFSVVNPAGTTIGTAVVGSDTTINNVKFRITQGSTPWTTGAIIDLWPYPVWENITKNCDRLPANIWTHPLTGEFIYSSSHGPWVHPAPPGYMAEHGITTSIAALNKTFRDAAFDKP